MREWAISGPPGTEEQSHRGLQKTEPECFLWSFCACEQTHRYLFHGATQRGPVHPSELVYCGRGQDVHKAWGQVSRDSRSPVLRER